MSVQHSDWTYTLKRGPRYTRTINGFTYTIFKNRRDESYHYTKMDTHGCIVYRSMHDPLYYAERNPHHVMAYIEMRTRPR